MEISKRKEWLLRSGLILFGLAIGAIVSEVALGIIQDRSGSSFSSVEDLKRAMLDPEASLVKKQGKATLRDIITPHPDNNLIYHLRPHVETEFQGVPVETNSCGMRGPEYSASYNPQRYRIALLGDSFAFGWGVEENETFAHIMQQELNRLALQSGIEFEVLNFGVPGYSTFQQVALYKENAERFNPDAIFVFFVTNDFGYPFFVRDIQSNSNGLLSSTRFAKLLWKAADPEIEQQKMELEGKDPNSSLQELNHLAADSGIPLYIAINPRRGWFEDKHRLWALKENPTIRQINLRKPMMEVVRRREIAVEDLILPNDPHPSALRHKIWGEILASHFIEAVS